MTQAPTPVLPLKNSVAFSNRAGFKRVVLPKDNEADLEELPEQVRQALELVLAERIEDVFAAAIPGFSVVRPERRPATVE
ncbi:hypothetical protein Tel_09020 [Candidatus Tenderia electrophaga]|jgi:ATP-dependent Lon protease|uniref:Lon proteolytic domain-containing protein n=1 Tax=Candidatus Tenderia electrophaga TaxID=1748243 RepID=A0A0S2TDQ4_9GAMM|nr:hypothetical protein Tel_09020 [Candidatus Tenderia electrophaga]